jgi:hypothetical protein
MCSISGCKKPCIWCNGLPICTEEMHNCGSEECQIDMTFSYWKNKDQAIKDQAIKDQAIKDQAIKDQAIKDQAIKDQAIKDQVIKDQAIKDQAIKNREHNISKRKLRKLILTENFPLKKLRKEKSKQNWMQELYEYQLWNQQFMYSQDLLKYQQLMYSQNLRTHQSQYL